MDTDNTGDVGKEEIQCRICFDGPEGGRLIRPCQCKGSIAVRVIYDTVPGMLEPDFPWFNLVHTCRVSSALA